MCLSFLSRLSFKLLQYDNFTVSSIIPHQFYSMAIIRKRSALDRQNARRSVGHQRADGWFTTAPAATSAENTPLGEISFHIWFVNDEFSCNRTFLDYTVYKILLTDFKLLPYP